MTVEASEALVMSSGLKMIQIKNAIDLHNVLSRGIWIKNLLHCATQDVHLLGINLGNLHGISWVVTHLVGNNRTNTFSDIQQINHAILLHEGISTSVVGRIWLCVAIQLQNSTHQQSSQHGSWLYLHTGAQVVGRIGLKIREDIQTTSIEVTTSS